MVDEIWKEIEGYQGRYQISSRGRVYNSKTGRYLKHVRKQIGYPAIGLSIGNVKKLVDIHRLLGLYFVPNPAPGVKKYVHHKDHNKMNYDLHNLYWTTHSENVQFSYTEGGRIGRTNMKGKFGPLNPTSIPILQYDKEMNLVQEIIGVGEAARVTGSDASHIVKVCTGKLKSHNGFIWRYKKGT